jgi:hypothetical protein
MFCYTLHLDCLLFHPQGCCRFLAGKVAKKKIQESVHSEEYYQEDNKIGKKGDNFSGTYVLFRGLLPKIREEWSP